MSGKPIIFIGASGSGKSELAQYLVYNFEAIPIVSTTSRSPRIGEINGVHYHFKSLEEILEMIKDDKFVEYANYSGNYYGTTVEELQNKLEKAKYIVNVMEINGALAMKKKFPETIIVYIDCPIDVLMTRMHSRGDSFESITKRVKNYVEQKEYENIQYADYVVDNSKTLEETYLQIRDILEKI